MSSGESFKGSPANPLVFLAGSDTSKIRESFGIERAGGPRQPLVRGRVNLLPQASGSKSSPWLLLEKTLQDFLLLSSSADITPLYLCFSQFLL